MPTSPLVSLCIPTRNGTPWLAECLASALAQSYPHLEIIVADDASTDGTPEAARRLLGPRGRVVTAPRPLGMVENWNRSVRLAAGEWIKFLFQDDLLHPHCVERMVAAGEEHPGTGLVFCRREVLLEDPADPAAQRWRERYGVLDTQFHDLHPWNCGRNLFEQWLRHGFRMNFIGEPTAVMVRRECFQRLGLFHTRMHQGPDFEMWARVLFHYHVAFLAEPLCTFRYHSGSASQANHRGNRSWLDMLWLLEGLLSDAEIRRAYPALGRQRGREVLRLLRAEWRRWRHGLAPPLLFQVRTLAEYCAYRWSAMRGRPLPLHGEAV